MARYHTPAAAAIYQAAAQWRDRCLIADGSMFSDRQLWTPALLAEFKRCYVDNLLDGDGDFFEKFEEQLKSGSSELPMLAAEMLWVIYLFPERLMRGPLKREHIRRVWSWSGQPTLAQDHLLMILDEGIGNPGQGFNQYRWKEVVFFWLAISNFKAADEARKSKILSAPWEFANWMDSLEGSASRLMRHILPHLLFPDFFERIASTKQKRLLVEHFHKELGDETPPAGLAEAGLRDFKLLGIRRSLEQANEGKVVDFYEASFDTWQVKSTNGASPPSASGSPTEPWFRQFFESEDEANAAFDLFREVAQTLGVKGPDDPSARRVSVTYRKSSSGLCIRMNCAQTAVFTIFSKGAVQDQAHQAQVALIDGSAPEELVPERQFSSLYAGQKISLYRYALEALLEESAEIRTSLLEAAAAISSANPAIKSRHFKEAHRARLLRALFEPLMRATIFADGPIKGPVAEEDEAAAEDQEVDGYDVTDALAELFMPREKLETILRQLDRKKNVILQGAPGVGKTFLARRLAHLRLGRKDDATIQMVQFHQSYTYEDFIEGIRPEPGGDFAVRPGIFREICRAAEADPETDYFLIIDEINRGNLAKIFGELMMLVETDKRGESLRLPYSNDSFSVPENLYLIGTMNTADRSLAMVDHALRRRFAFFTLEPGFEEAGFAAHLDGMGIPLEIVTRIRTKMRGLNTKIEEMEGSLGAGYRIGHSFFTPSKPQADAEQWYRDVVEHEILPLVAEYWMDHGTMIAAHRKDLLDQ